MTGCGPLPGGGRRWPVGGPCRGAVGAVGAGLSAVPGRGPAPPGAAWPVPPGAAWPVPVAARRHRSPPGPAHPCPCSPASGRIRRPPASCRASASCPWWRHVPVRRYRWADQRQRVPRWTGRRPGPGQKGDVPRDGKLTLNSRPRRPDRPPGMSVPRSKLFDPLCGSPERARRGAVDGRGPLGGRCGRAPHAGAVPGPAARIRPRPVHRCAGAYAPLPAVPLPARSPGETRSGRCPRWPAAARTCLVPRAGASPWRGVCRRPSASPQPPRPRSATSHAPFHRTTTARTTTARTTTARTTRTSPSKTTADDDVMPARPGQARSPEHHDRRRHTSCIPVSTETNRLGRGCTPGFGRSGPGLRRPVPAV